MIPIQARQALRIGRVALAMACLAWYPFTEAAGITSTLAFLIAYAIFSAGTLFETRFDSQPRAIVALVIDAAFFAFCKWLLPAEWATSLAFGYVMLSAAILHPPLRVIIVGCASLGLYVLAAFQGAAIPWLAIVITLICFAYALHRQYLELRMSNTLRYNVIVRSQAEIGRAHV